MRSILALTRAAWLAAASYRISLVFSIASLLLTVVPVYFLSKPLGVAAGTTIADQATDYFGFVVVGMCAFFMISTAITAIPGALTGTIGSGTLEALLVTRTPLWQTFIGIGAYGLLWSAVRALVMLAAAAALGTHVAWGGLLSASLVILLLVIAHFGIGIFAAALILVFRTAGPFTTVVLTASGLFGGAYFSASVLPGFLKQIPVIFPLYWGLPAIRRVLLLGEPLSAISDPLLVLAGMSFVLIAVSTACFVVAFRYARKAGTLSQY